MKTRPWCRRRGRCERAAATTPDRLPHAGRDGVVATYFINVTPYVEEAIVPLVATPSSLADMLGDGELTCGAIDVPVGA